jgi:uncharacterized protein YndB with AHSA1/START domain
MEHITRETVLDADPSDVWEAVTEQLEEWTGGRRAVVERIREPRELVFRFLDDPSRVTITIEPTPDGSVVRVVEQRIEAAVSPVPTIGFKALART